MSVFSLSSSLGPLFGSLWRTVGGGASASVWCNCFSFGGGDLTGVASSPSSSVVSSPSLSLAWWAASRPPSARSLTWTSVGFAGSPPHVDGLRGAEVVVGGDVVIHVLFLLRHGGTPLIVFFLYYYVYYYSGCFVLYVPDCKDVQFLLAVV
ncbi:hypothetical protein STCU_11253 [Strigomonas culicis]|uniref:Uncharacterized protein n=1 Tax=Strigomonas culicis TaxID=28005 RepID=S9THR9_9TRYP|nr:hypothetical protein STCU_11253 [Strigomonas culicis]|eukprot:EPY16449.1 hypothetical protein STCU_11253 [Strigomonas culicis]